jgi:thiol-disulfide isomerase/thioredoxin
LINRSIKECSRNGKKILIVGGVDGRFGVQVISTLLLFKDGNEVRRFVGVQNHNTLIEAINKSR